MKTPPTETLRLLRKHYTYSLPPESTPALPRGTVYLPGREELDIHANCYFCSRIRNAWSADWWHLGESGNRFAVPTRWLRHLLLPRTPVKKCEPVPEGYVFVGRQRYRKAWFTPPGWLCWDVTLGKEQIWSEGPNNRWAYHEDFVFAAPVTHIGQPLEVLFAPA